MLVLARYKFHITLSFLHYDFSWVLASHFACGSSQDIITAMHAFDTQIPKWCTASSRSLLKIRFTKSFLYHVCFVHKFSSSILISLLLVHNSIPLLKIQLQLHCTQNYYLTGRRVSMLSHETAALLWPLNPRVSWSLIYCQHTRI